MQVGLKSFALFWLFTLSLQICHKAHLLFCPLCLHSLIPSVLNTSENISPCPAASKMGRPITPVISKHPTCRSCISCGCKGSSQLQLHHIKLQVFKANGHGRVGAIITLTHPQLRPSGGGSPTPDPIYPANPREGTPRVLCVRPPAICMMQVTLYITGIMQPFALDDSLSTSVAV